MTRLPLRLLPGRYAVCRLEPTLPLPAWAQSSFSVTRTREELSIVLDETQVPPEVQAERGWACLAVEGILDFALTGILAALALPLAEAGIPIFALSTYDTDYLLVKAAQLEEAIRALEDAGHTLRRPQ